MISTNALSIDAVRQSADALSISDLERFLQDMRNSPAWRQRAEMECDYYDGNQHTADDIEWYQERNLPIVTVNMVAPTLNLVIGMEAQTRTDWMVKSDGSAQGLTAKQADGLSAKLNDAERNTFADQACADAYASQIKAGLGWVEVSRSQNPFDYPLRVSQVDRREIYWDMRAKDFRRLTDARWLVRKKWNDLDAVLTLVPEEMRSFVEAAVHNPSGWDMSQFQSTIPMVQDALFARDWMNDPSEWCDSERLRVCAYEVWYRKWTKGLVICFADGRCAEYNKKNPSPMHVASIASRVATLKFAAYQKMRLSWWVGPFRLLDVESPYGVNEFPYVPFWGYMEDATRTPYGMIRSMKSLQDEVNARRAQMMWQLSAKRVIAEGDAVDDHDAAAAEVNRPDAYIVLSKARKQRGSAKAFDVQENTGMSTQQFNVYLDAKTSLQQAGGVHGPALGDPNSGVEAGVAIDALIQQTATSLAGINNNYRFARTEVGRKLLTMVLEDMKGKETRVSLPKTAPSGAKSVTFNRKKVDPQTGLYTIENDTSLILWKVALGDVPNSPTHNQRRLKDLVEFAKSLPDELKVIFADLVVMASDLPNKDQIAERIRAQTGMRPEVDPDTATDEELQEAQAYQQQQDQQARIQQLAQQLELEEQASKADVNRSKAALLRTQMEGTLATSALTRAQTIETLLTINLDTAGPPKKNADGKGMPAPPKAAPPSDEEMSGAAGSGFALETPRHDDRLSMGGDMNQTF